MAISLKEFSRQVQESGLVSGADLAAAKKALAQRSKQDAERLARILVRQEQLTAYQARQIYRGKGERLKRGNYLVLDRLGRGGMGQVYKARHLRMDRLVALKVVSSRVTRSAAALARFQREVRTAALLSHPNIVAAYDADDAGGQYFLVMEYVAGVDLSVRVRGQGVLLPDQAVDCLVQAARGLEYAHHEGVVHRDIKPANLLLATNGQLKVLDMGLARLESGESDDDQLTRVGQIMGTVDFMAPEQAENTKAVDGRADIYSLGATLWYVLTGRPLYEGQSPVRKLMAHQKQPIPSLREACPAVGSELEAVFRKMVAKTPEARFSSMGEVIEALEALTAGGTRTPVRAELPAEDERLREFFRQMSDTDTEAVPAAVALATAEEKSSDENGTVSQFSSFSDTDPDSVPIIAVRREVSVAHARRRHRRRRRGWRMFWAVHGPKVTLFLVVVLLVVLSLIGIWGMVGA